MADDLIAFTREMDRCWTERRFGDLRSYIANDVVMAPPDGKRRIASLDAAIESYREFMSRCELERFATFDHVVSVWGSTAVVDYHWDMAWSEQ